MGGEVVDVCAVRLSDFTVGTYRYIFAVSCIRLGLKPTKQYKFSLHLKSKKHPETFAFLLSAV